MEGRVSLDDIDLVPTADRLVELTEEMRIARIRPVHRLELEAGIEARRFRIERALYRQQSLVQQEGIGAIRKEMAEIEPVGRPDGITRDASFGGALSTLRSAAKAEAPPAIPTADATAPAATASARTEFHMTPSPNVAL